MTASRDQQVNWKNVPTRTITAGGVEFAYRELGTNNPGPPVVFLVHLAAVLDNWDPRVVDGFAGKNSYDLAQRLPNSDLIIYPDSGHGAVFQFHADFVPKALSFLAR